MRIALFGLGNRGSNLIDMLEWLIGRGHAEITAISDITPTRPTGLDRIAQFQTNAPRAGQRGRMLAHRSGGHGPDLHPVEWHTPMAARHAAGIAAASEVPIATTYREGIDLIQVAEDAAALHHA